MTKKVINYKTLSSIEPIDLDKRVKTYISKGYELYGHALTTFNGEYGRIIHTQVMVKYDKSEVIKN